MKKLTAFVAALSLLGCSATHKEVESGASVSYDLFSFTVSNGETEYSEDYESRYCSLKYKGARYGDLACDQNVDFVVLPHGISITELGNGKEITDAFYRTERSRLLEIKESLEK